MNKVLGFSTILFIFLYLGVTTSFAAPQTISGVFDVYAEYNSTSPYPCGPVNYESVPLDTGIDIIRGDIINITASGSWSLGGDYVYGPDGASYPDWLPDCALLGKISEAQLPFFEEDPWAAPEKYLFIGSNLQNYISPVDGRFYLAFKDTNYGDNRGYVTANVAVTRAAPVPESATLSLLVLGLVGLVLKKREVK